jgi:hypothetical protein
MGKKFFSRTPLGISVRYLNVNNIITSNRPPIATDSAIMSGGTCISDNTFPPKATATTDPTEKSRA